MKLWNWITLTISMLSLVLIGYIGLHQSRVVYIRCGDVLDKYMGSQEANNKLKEKIAQHQGIIDTIRAEYQMKKVTFESNGSMNNGQQNTERLLMENLQQIKQFEESEAQELAKEHEQLFSGVLNQINAFTEIYAKKNKYDLVIGTTNTGNLMYGNKKLDVTDDFIKQLNSYYKNGI